MESEQKRLLLIKLVFFTCIVMITNNAYCAVYVATNSTEIQSYSDILTPGDTLQVQAGTYTMSTWRIRNIHGSPGNWITIEPTGGKVTIVGNANQNVINMDNISYVDFKGLEITYSGSNPDIDGIKFNAGTTSEYVIIQYCHIHNVTGVGINSKAIELQWFGVLWNHVHDTNGTGEGMYFGHHDGSGNIHDALIANNWVHDTHGSQGDGIEVKRGCYNVVLKDNVIYNTNGYPGITLYKTDKSDITMQNVVEGNVIWNAGEGIFAVGETDIYNNVVFNCDYGINTRNYGGWGMNDLRIMNNTVYSCNVTCARLGDWNISTGDMRFVNNALYQDSLSKMAIRVPSGTGSATVTNNYYYGVSELASGVTLGSIPTNEFINPTIVPGSIDLYPLPTSSLINNGQDLSLIFQKDFNGITRPISTAWEIGAYEYGTPGNPGWQIQQGFKPVPTPMVVPVINSRMIITILVFFLLVFYVTASNVYNKRYSITCQKD